jgi:DNA-binding response OmpR family regulator
MRILIAEDDRDSRQLLKILLQENGHEVIACENGLQAWAAFQGEAFSLVISDWRMPGLDGIDLCRKIRSAVATHYTYIVLLTALKGKTNYLEAMNAGADDFISKPYDPEELTARLVVAERILHLQEHVKRLEGVLPTCMYCKRIRDGANAWIGMEQYITQRTEASFSHGVCPDCYDQIVRPQINRVRTTGEPQAES